VATILHASISIVFVMLMCPQAILLAMIIDDKLNKLMSFLFFPQWVGALLGGPKEYHY